MRHIAQLAIAVTADIVITGAAFAAGSGDPIPLPMPATLTLLATGFAGLAGAAWWLRRKK